MSTPDDRELREVFKDVPPELLEIAEDTCDFVHPDGTVCGAHIGYGIRLLHLGRCDEHKEAP